MMEQPMSDEVLGEMYQQIIGIEHPWRVTQMEFTHSKQMVYVHVSHDGGDEYRCPKCGDKCQKHGHRQRQWRHLDSAQYQTYLVSEVPRVECNNHGVVTVAVPWAHAQSPFTIHFEEWVIGWLRDASPPAVASFAKLSENAIDGIVQRAARSGN